VGWLRRKAADYRARKKALDQLPKQIEATPKREENLIKTAKGLGE
jgi:hypothetical protein